MLKIWITLFLCLAFTGVYAQIEMASPVQWKLLGEVKSIGITIAKMEFHTSGNDTVYFLLMKDFRKQQEINYFSLKFNSTANAFGTLYELLKSFFLNENKKNKDYMQTFRLGQEGVNLQHCTLVARHGVRLTTRDGYINLSEKNIDQLFGIK